MKVNIPDAEAAAFAARLVTDEYRKDERDYKVAVHVVLSALFSPEISTRDDFPQLLADVFGEALPDMNALGIPAEQQQFVKQATGSFGAGLKQLRLHDLRHTAAALAISAGAHPKAIQERLGHASVATTLNVYGHLFPALDEELAARLDDAARAAAGRMRDEGGKATQTTQ